MTRSGPGFMQYDSQYPLYGLSFSHSPSHPHRAALTTLHPGPSNKLLVVDTKPGEASDELHSIASVNLTFPATKVAWEPAQSVAGNAYTNGQTELLATTGDVLRIWDLGRDWKGDTSRGYVGRGGAGGGGGYETEQYVLNTRSVLTNSKSPQTSLPPITSFAWNPDKPESIVTCSIDTTATLWDINTSQAITQLIAHDRAVYDLAWLPQSPDIFVSVGADGSLRAFDLRQLEHSTILYESPGSNPLARIAFSNTEQHMLACFGLDDSKTFILDMRSPGQPVAELMGHSAPLGAISWGGGPPDSESGGGWIASCGDDCQLLLYDLTGPLPAPRQEAKSQTAKSSSPANYAFSPPATPNDAQSPPPAKAAEIMPAKAWTADSEIVNLAFTDSGNQIGAISGSKLSILDI
ncbi:putative transparent testa glabra 1 protein [Papiliotrema laurentii]|uniref:Transparent testa glabra 1 protein n=1 Tax=Papiliotrema laurentii TaxID=5418 RepID=A0AAD9CV65_PAPLA|nr:putative transparent testa glabra 1 protein [Papiliotrema laurentii]